jgi:hypothetical protein
VFTTDHKFNNIKLGTEIHVILICSTKALIFQALTESIGSGRIGCICAFSFFDPFTIERYLSVPNRTITAHIRTFQF